MKAMESEAKSYNFLVSQGVGGETKIFSFFWLHLILLRPLKGRVKRNNELTMDSCPKLPEGRPELF
jgi:hypothetical protein